MKEQLNDIFRDMLILKERNFELQKQMLKLQEIVEHQANMKTLWLANPTITESILMKALRHLHAVIEGDEVIAEFAKKEYWEVETEL